MRIAAVFAVCAAALCLAGPRDVSASMIYAAQVGNSGSDPAFCTYPGGQGSGNSADPVSAGLDCRGNGSGAAVATASPGHLGVSAIASDSGFGAYGMSASAFLEGDVVFRDSDPNATTANVFFALGFGGILSSTFGAGAQAQAFATMDGVDVGDLNEANLNGLFTCNATFVGGNPCGPEFTGIMHTSLIPVPLNVPVPVSLFLQVDTGTGSQGESALATFLNSLDFVSGQDLFTLDPGVTVDSADLDIVNNRFIAPNTVPEPSSLVLLGVGLGVLAIPIGRFRRNRLNTLQEA